MFAFSSQWAAVPLCVWLRELTATELVKLQAAQTTGREKCVQRNMRPHEFVTQHVLGRRTFTSGLSKMIFWDSSETMVKIVSLKPCHVTTTVVIEMHTFKRNQEKLVCWFTI